MTRFTMIPTYASIDSRINYRHLQVLISLGFYINSADGWGFPSYQTLANITGIGRNHILGIMKDLVEWNYVFKESRMSKRGDATSNRYKINCNMECIDREFIKADIATLPFPLKCIDPEEEGVDPENGATLDPENGATIFNQKYLTKSSSSSKSSSSFSPPENDKDDLIENDKNNINLDKEEDEEEDDINRYKQDVIEKYNLSPEEYETIAGRVRIWIDKQEKVSNLHAVMNKFAANFKQAASSLSTPSQNFSTDIDGHINKHPDPEVRNFLSRIRKRWEDGGYISWMMNTRLAICKTTNTLKISIQGDHAARFIYDRFLNPVKLRALEGEAKLIGFAKLEIINPSP